MQAKLILAFAIVMAHAVEGVDAAYEIFSKTLSEAKGPQYNSVYDTEEYFQRAQLGGITLGRDGYYLPTLDGYLEKRDLTTHHRIWRAKLAAPSQSAWATSEDQVFGGDTKGQFYGIDAKKGIVLWKTSTKGVFFSRPLIHADKVYVATSHSVLQAYDRHSGQWLWQQSDPGSASLGLWSSEGPAWFQGQVVAGFPSGTLVAFEPTTGKPIWNESFSDKIQVADNFNDLKSILSTSEYLFASSFSGNLRAWEAVKGSKKLLWEKRISLHAPMTLDSASGMVFASARDGKVYAIDMKSGFLKWEYELPRGLGGQPSLLDGNLWVGTSSGLVVVLDSQGKLLAKSNDYQTSIWNGLVPLSKELLAIDGRGLLRRLNLVKTH